MTKVSVVIPVYNCETFIHDAVISVMTQTERDTEIIVVDDGSTDNTLALLDILTSKDMRIKICKQIHSGVPAIARNNGLKNANGEFICFLDGDDLYHPQKIEKSLEVFANHPEIDLVFHDVKFLCHDGAEVEGTYLATAGFQQKAHEYLEHAGGRVYITSPEFYSFMSTTITGIHTSSVMIRKKRLDLESIWFPEELLIGEDIDLWFRLVKNNRIGFINEVLSFYRQHELSISKNVEKVLVGSIRAHTRNYERGQDLLSKKQNRLYRKRISKQYYYLGYIHFCEGRSKEARKSFLRAMELAFNNAYVLAFLKTYIPIRSKLYRILHSMRHYVN